jgi:hypothetical protein
LIDDKRVTAIPSRLKVVHLLIMAWVATLATIFVVSCLNALIEVNRPGIPGDSIS